MNEEYVGLACPRWDQSQFFHSLNVWYDSQLYQPLNLHIKQSQIKSNLLRVEIPTYLPIDTILKGKKN